MGAKSITERNAMGAGCQGYRWSYIPVGDQFDHAKCNTKESGIGKTSTIDRFPKGISPEGCYDLAGNVWEWTRTIYNTQETANDFKPDIDYIYAPTPKGGSWLNDAENARCDSRGRLQPHERCTNLGFRCVRNYEA